MNRCLFAALEKLLDLSQRSHLHRDSYSLNHMYYFFLFYEDLKRVRPNLISPCEIQRTVFLPRKLSLGLSFSEFEQKLHIWVENKYLLEPKRSLQTMRDCIMGRQTLLSDPNSKKPLIELYYSVNFK